MHARSLLLVVSPLLLTQIGAPLAAQQFGSLRIIVSDPSGRPTSVSTADLDDDGDLDILHTSAMGHGWQRNLDGAGTFQFPFCLPQTFAGGDIQAVDVDLDGDLDLVACAALNLSWFENLDGQGQYGPQNTITGDSFFESNVAIGDINGDGYPDILFASQFSPIRWFANIGASGGFGPANVLANADSNRSRSVDVGDVDADGDLDILFTTYIDDVVAWLENLDGAGTFALQMISNEDLAPGSPRPQDGIFADMDSDGDLDVVAAGDFFRWYENVDGLGSFSAGTVVEASVDVEYVAAADIDADGDLDLLIGAPFRGASWLENLDDSDQFGPAIVLFPSTSDGDVNVHAADLDGNGSPDFVFCAESQSGDDVVGWFPNLSDVEQRSFLLIGFAPDQLSFGLDDHLLLEPLAWLPIDLQQPPHLGLPFDTSFSGLHVYMQLYSEQPWSSLTDPVQTSNGLDIVLGQGALPYGPATDMSLFLDPPMTPASTFVVPRCSLGSE